MLLQRMPIYPSSRNFWPGKGTLLVLIPGDELRAPPLFQPLAQCLVQRAEGAPQLPRGVFVTKPSFQRICRLKLQKRNQKSSGVSCALPKPSTHRLRDMWDADNLAKSTMILKLPQGCRTFRQRPCFSGKEFRVSKATANRHSTSQTKAKTGKTSPTLPKSLP